MASALRFISDTFWSEWFWLPEGIGWSDFKGKEGEYYPRVRDLYIPFFLAFVIFAIRKCFER